MSPAEQHALDVGHKSPEHFARAMEVIMREMRRRAEDQVIRERWEKRAAAKATGEKLGTWRRGAAPKAELAADLEPALERWEAGDATPPPKRRKQKRARRQWRPFQRATLAAPAGPPPG